MGYDAFGLFRGWCTRASACLEYSAVGEAADAADANPLRCSHCRCLPQEHVPAKAEGYDPNSPEHLAERRKYDARLLPPEERAAIFKGRADAAFKERNFRTAYLEYTRAIEATPDNHVLLGNRCQTYLKVGKVSAALQDAEKAVSLAADWAKGHYRLGLCLQRMDQHAEAVRAFEHALSLNRESGECRKALDEARAKKSEWDDQQEKLAKARKRTTIRQAADAYETAKYEAKKKAKERGLIKEITEFGGELEAQFEVEYKANIAPPPGVDYALTDTDDEDEQARQHEAALLDDSRFVPETKAGSTAISLPPRNFILVHEDGRLHAKDDFEPMSFGMQRIHNDDEPEPIWVQTKTSRWMQTLSDVTIIPHTVPPALCRSSEVKVSFSRRQVHVQAVISKQIYMAGELERPIDPNQSTWTTDGSYITIVCVKENLCIYDGSRGQESDTHWHRLFTTDQFVERGMIPANYYDMPSHIKMRNKMAEGKRKAKEEEEKQANLCPICGKDVRFFCSCRDEDKDYERPIPQGWKDSKLGFNDNYEQYSLSEPALIKDRPPEQPRPYQGRVAPKYGLDGKGTEEREPEIKMLGMVE